MKVLLIANSSSRSSRETNITGVYPPLGLAYIASVLRDAGQQVIFLDNQILNFCSNSLKNEIKKIAPDIVLLSAMTPLWPELIILSKLIKDVSKQIIVGVGGPHLTAYPQESLSNNNFDFGVFGEGEKTILEIVNAIQEGRWLDGIKGCIFRKNGEIIINSPREEIDDLDSIPFPAIDLLPYKKYFAFSVKHPLATIVTSRGCPYSCKFCFQDYLGSYRARSPENVIEEIEILVNKYKIQEIIVFDETFAVEEERVLKICELIHKKNIKFKWDIRTRVDLLKDEVLKSLKSAGCSRIHLGIESGDQDILCQMGKNISISEIVEKVNLAKKIGFELRGYFMLAYPGEKYRTICKTIEFAKSLPLDWASFTITLGLPETDIYKQALKMKYFDSDYWREYTKGAALGPKPFFIPLGLKNKDLYNLKKKAYLKFYFRPRIIWNIAKSLKSTVGIKNFYSYIKLIPSFYSSITKI